jgi:hypothetical protein
MVMQEAVCRPGPLDGEALGPWFNTPMPLREAQIVEEAGEVEELRVVLSAITLGTYVAHSAPFSAAVSIKIDDRSYLYSIVDPVMRSAELVPFAEFPSLYGVV